MSDSASGVSKACVLQYMRHGVFIIYGHMYVYVCSG